MGPVRDFVAGLYRAAQPDLKGDEPVAGRFVAGTVRQVDLAELERHHARRQPHGRHGMAGCQYAQARGVDMDGKAVLHAHVDRRRIARILEVDGIGELVHRSRDKALRSRAFGCHLLDVGIVGVYHGNAETAFVIGGVDIVGGYGGRQPETQRVADVDGRVGGEVQSRYESIPVTAERQVGEVGVIPCQGIAGYGGGRIRAQCGIIRDTGIQHEFERARGCIAAFVLHTRRQDEGNGRPHGTRMVDPGADVDIRAL